MVLILGSRVYCSEALEIIWTLANTCQLLLERAALTFLVKIEE